MGRRMLSDERAKFETWRASANPGANLLDRNMPDGSYNNPATHERWQGWQARAALAQAEPSAAPLDIRLNDDGTLDEIVGTGTIHLEQMDTNHWWMQFECAGGKTVTVSLQARGAIKATHEMEAVSVEGVPR
jgi:hypothetical protein